MYKWNDGFKPDICDKDEQCRYVLGKKGKNTLICIGANPSVASDDKCDPTMNRLCSILQNNGYDGFVMLNLYPLIATNPDELPPDFDEKIHAKNLAKIEAVLAEFKSDILLCYGGLLNMRKYLKEPCLKDILKLFDEHKFDGHKIKCLGTTKNGLPKHPLGGIRKTTKIIDFKKPL
ncbi:DUF1643 domain-containing protein [Helicobacter sp. 10-6591]|uniref:DUF1643 domain-containing protein n=1 Tax=Helicobacter sp. 10-6591 TaxID=2004998 RepID=UPI000DCEE501|nr:DUF1643 domain-containing protein [Helicobacter sp. 10-6591]RAX55875.1 hypothetical protein CCY97_01895 [Helicobacter sp. 10-6591]